MEQIIKTNIEMPTNESSKPPHPRVDTREGMNLISEFLIQNYLGRKNFDIYWHSSCLV